MAVFYIPESPHFLMSKGQEEKAEAALNLLDIDLSVMATMNLEHRENTVHETFSQKLKKPENWKPFLSGIILMTFFQGTAYPIMIGNTLSMFREVSESIDEHIASTVVGIAIVVFALMAIPLAKKCERKTLLGISALGVCACLFTLGAFYYLKTYAEVDNFGWVALLDFLIYIGFFTVTISENSQFSKVHLGHFSPYFE